MTIAQFEVMFPNENACKEYLTKHRWSDGVIRCPRCGFDKVFEHKRPYHWNCYNCSPDGIGYRFSVLVGTIFENTNKPLRDWFRVMHMMLTSKKGISALQIFRVMGFGSYRTALGMCNKIRVALGNTEFKQLVGYVEIDETYVGGKAKNKHKGPGGRGDWGGRGTKNKAIIMGAVRRKGNVIARVVENTDIYTIKRFMKEVVSHRVSLISTDDHAGYRYIDRRYKHHGMVHHAAGEYVCGSIHTNTIEGFWSLIKRGIMGTFHKVSRKYLPLYVNEFQFRYNNRMNPDIFGAAIRAC
jgi:transposase-like protein